MKRLVICFVISCIPAITYAGELFVAPDGNDGNRGDKNGPFASIERARETILAAPEKEAWTVNIAEGTYRIDRPIVFEPENSGTQEKPVIYRGTGKNTLVSGGVVLSGWKEHEPGVWVSDIPVTDNRPVYFEQLFVNSRRAIRARYPDAGFLNPAGIRQEAPISADYRGKGDSEQTMIAKPGELDILANLPKDELTFAHFVIHHHWDTTRRIPLEYDAKKYELRMHGLNMKHWNPWRETSQYYIENVRTAFNLPGEWFYDGNARKVYYRPLPGETLENSEFVIPRSGLTSLLEFRGNENAKVENIRFENISFAYTDTPRREEPMRASGLDATITGNLDFPGPSQVEPAQAASGTDAALMMENCKSIVLADCEIKHLGEYGIWVRNSSDCRIERCALTDLGAGGVRIGGAGSTKNCVLDNCIIQHGGRFHASATAVWIGNGTEDIRVTHNDIGDFYYTGISAGWTWGYQGGVAFRNIIEFNRIHDLGQGALADMGGVYTLGTSHGTRVCNNVIFNVKSYAYGGWGLYPDEGSEGILMENNLVHDTTDGSFHQHYGKHNIVRNNILAFSSPHQVAATRIEPHLSFTFERNIVYWNTGKAIGYSSEKVRADWGNNLWFNAAGPVDFNGKTHEEWLAIGKDVGGVIADPMFVDAEKRDFRLKEGSPVDKIGFVPFDFSKAGVYGDDNWLKRAKNGE